MPLTELKHNIQQWAQELGFADSAITDTKLDNYVPKLQQWLDDGYQGDMQWIEKALAQRSQPQLLLPEVITVICVRLNYLPQESEPVKVLKSPQKAYISRYALGRDYHKMMRKRLALLAEKIRQWVAQHEDQISGLTLPLSQRPFVDSAPVLEKPLAEKAGLGWIGKNTLLLNQQEGSWFFLGELFTNLPLPIDQPVEDRCGNCRACLKVCPTNAFPKPYVLDASKCISYLTIEHDGVIAENLRGPMGNRVFGCDDCQLICPWNRYAKFTQEDDFQPRHQLQDSDLVTLFEWDEQMFLEKTAGSAIRRAGYLRWQRNLAIGLGNSHAQPETVKALRKRLSDEPGAMVAEHIEWALQRQESAAAPIENN